ncbi:MAG: SUMF1/EgtB/PvdO family nonheme iron enzyme [bacterium]
MKRTLLLLFATIILSIQSSAQEVLSLGKNPDTGLEEIRVVLHTFYESRVSFDMVLIPSGTFTMGCEQNPVDAGVTWPPHKVTITRPFYIGKQEFTQGLMRAITGLSRTDYRSNPATRGDEFPEYRVSWFDCELVANTITAMGAGTFRLPTEAEWEYACRAGQSARVSFSAAQLDDIRKTKRVGTSQPNAWGIYDMIGNVDEWCSDWWEEAHDRKDQINPQGPSEAPEADPFGPTKVVRGEVWGEACGLSYRYSRIPTGRGSELGFRLVREHEPSCVNEWALYE